MASQGFEEIDHTADLALRVWGENFEGLFRQAAEGLYYLLNVSTKQDTFVEESFMIDRDSHETMLVDFLNELLYLCEDKGLVFQSFAFSRSPEKLIVRARGEEAASIARNIKAVTFHDLEIHKKQTGLETTLTFDV